MRFILIIIFTLFVSGCAAKREPIQHVGSIKANDNRVSGIDVYKKRREAGEKTPDFRGDQFVTIRTVIYDEGVLPAFRKEITGAKCEIKSAEFSAKLTTPAKVQVPIYGYETGEIALICKLPDYKRSVETVRSMNKTKTDRLVAGSNVGLVGLVFMAAVNAASDEKKHVFLYPDVNITMYPEKNLKQ